MRGCGGRGEGASSGRCGAVGGAGGGAGGDAGSAVGGAVGALEVLGRKVANRCAHEVEQLAGAIGATGSQVASDAG